MTFEEWWHDKLGNRDDWIKDLCQSAWDYQQRIIDEILYDLNHAEKACDRLQERIEQQRIAKEQE